MRAQADAAPAVERGKNGKAGKNAAVQVARRQADAHWRAAFLAGDGHGARHGLIDLDIQAVGDLHIDGHHLVEDVGITLGQAFAQAVGDKKGVRRYGHAYVPLDEALSRVVVDLSGRPGLELNIPFTSGAIGGFDTQLAHEFFQGFVNHAGITVHIDNLKGNNAHHQAESVFKAFARALRAAVEPDPRSAGVIPSTTGSL